MDDDRRSCAGPAWVARLGRLGWWVVGITVGVAALVLAVGAVLPLVLPLLVMAVVAVCLQPLVDRLRRIGVPNGLAVFVGAIAVPATLLCLGALLVHAVAVQASGLRHVLVAGGAVIRDTLGADPVRAVLESDRWRTVIFGVGSALTSAAMLLGQAAVGLLIGTYLLYYTLREGPRCIGWIERRLPLPAEDARALLSSATLRVRRYAIGTTVIAAVDAVAITAGALVLGLPFVATIAAVTFVAAYVPYLGALVSGTFAVILALGSGGVINGLWMLGIVLVTQNVLEGVLRPYVFGRALELHPLVMLAATVAGAAVGGLAAVFMAPLIAAIVVSWWSSRRRR